MTRWPQRRHPRPGLRLYAVFSGGSELTCRRRSRTRRETGLFLPTSGTAVIASPRRASPVYASACENLTMSFQVRQRQWRVVAASRSAIGDPQALPKRSLGHGCGRRDTAASGWDNAGPGSRLWPPDGSRVASASLRTQQPRCPHCGASGAGCDPLTWLGGRRCCDACTGDHDAPTTERNTMIDTSVPPGVRTRSSSC